jgi:cellulose biosynthesis protein BcsQ
VGRSTAICIAARHFVKKGLKVLVLDMDLESPGLSGLMLPPGRLSAHGIADWFVEDALGQAGEPLLENLVADSPLASEWPGSVRVTPAFGRDEADYIPKLARIYAELSCAGSGTTEKQSFPDRFFQMLTAIKQREVPDMVLLDSRAGLHDIAATLLVRVPAALRLLFSTNSPQTWLGYRQLF